MKAKLVVSTLIMTMLISTTALAGPLPVKNPRSSMRQSLKIDTRGFITKTPNGRNLAVARDDKVTIKKLPEVWHTPDAVLGLPDNGKQLNEHLPAPEAPETPVIKEKTVREIGGEAKTVSGVSYLKIHGNVTPDEYNDFLTYLNKVIEEDRELVQSAVDAGWTIVLTSEDLDDLLFDGETDGVEGCTYFPTGESPGTVYVHAGKYSYCIIHEFGHVLDSLCAYPSQTSEFKELYDSEASALTEYGQESPMEFFAEIYSNLMLQPETTKKACPAACDFIENCRYEKAA